MKLQRSVILGLVYAAICAWCVGATIPARAETPDEKVARLEKQLSDKIGALSADEARLRQLDLDRDEITLSPKDANTDQKLAKINAEEATLKVAAAQKRQQLKEYLDALDIVRGQTWKAKIGTGTSKDDLKGVLDCVEWMLQSSQPLGPVVQDTYLLAIQLLGKIDPDYSRGRLVLYGYTNRDCSATVTTERWEPRFKNPNSGLVYVTKEKFRLDSSCLFHDDKPAWNTFPKNPGEYLAAITKANTELVGCYSNQVDDY